VFEGSI